MPLETDEKINTGVLSPQSGRHGNRCNSQAHLLVRRRCRHLRVSPRNGTEGARSQSDQYSPRQTSTRSRSDQHRVTSLGQPGEFGAHVFTLSRCPTLLNSTLRVTIERKRGAFHLNPHRKALQSQHIACASSRRHPVERIVGP